MTTFDSQVAENGGDHVTQAWLSRREKVIARGVGHMSRLVVTAAEGAYVWDADGKRYIDFAAGIGTLNIGHRHPRVMGRLRAQLDKLHHVAVGVAVADVYVELAERLCQITPGDFTKKAVLLNSGAEAVENAIKIARAATGRPAVISFDSAFHGRTLLTMSLSAKVNPYKADFGPFAPEVYSSPYAYCYRCPYGNTNERAACPIHRGDPLQRMLELQVEPQSVAAVIVEPVAGEGGFIVPPPEFLLSVERVCRENGILLIVDEIQTGFGRTGAMFACNVIGLEPDLLCIGKSVANGLPLSAVVGRANVMDGPRPGSLGGTYTGNPLACAAALGVLEVFDTEDILEKSRRLGDLTLSRFQEWSSEFELIGDVRGMGAMTAIELVRDRKTRIPAARETQAVLDYCHKHGLLLIKAGMHDNVVRTLMPLNIPADALEIGLGVMEESLHAVSAKLSR